MDSASALLVILEMAWTVQVSMTYSFFLKYSEIIKKVYKLEVLCYFVQFKDILNKWKAKMYLC